MLKRDDEKKYKKPSDYKKVSKTRAPKKKAFQATWDDSTSEEEEEEETNEETACLGLMATNDGSESESEEPEVNPYSLDELQDAFDSLYIDLKKTKTQSKALKEEKLENKRLINDLEEKNLILTKETTALNMQIKNLMIEKESLTNDLYTAMSEQKFLDREELLDKIHVLEKSNSFKKDENGLLRVEIRALEDKLDIMKIEINHLKEKSNQLLEDLAKFTKGKDNLDKLIAHQKPSSSKFGLGFYEPSQSEPKRDPPLKENTNKYGSTLQWIPKRQLSLCFVGMKGHHNVKNWIYKMKDGRLKLERPIETPSHHRRSFVGGRRSTRRKTRRPPPPRRPMGDGLRMLQTYDRRQTPIFGPPTEQLHLATTTRAILLALVK